MRLAKEIEGGRPELKRHRKMLGVDQVEVARRCALSESLISELETGRGGKSARGKRQLRTVCRALAEIAAELGYDAAEFHESLLCPGEFPSPAPRELAEVSR